MNQPRATGTWLGDRFALWAYLVVFLCPFALQAQAYGYIPEPISPTSYEECKQMSDQFQAELDDLSNQRSACVTNHTKQTFPTGDVGSCCHEWSGADAVRAGACWEGFSPCWSLMNQWYCVAINQSAARSRCQDKVKEYQRKQEEERKKQEEEKRRAEQAAQDAKKDESSSSSESTAKDASSKDDKKSAFEREVEAYNKDTERLAELTAERNAQAHQLDRATAKANKKLSAEAEKTASTNKDVLTRLAELGDSLGHSKDLGSGKAGTDPAPAFDFAGGDATLDRTLAAAGLVVPPFASIPFSMVSNAFRAELGLMNQVAAAVRDFDHLDPSFANRNFAAEFGQKVFSPSEFLRTVATHTASGLVDEYVVKPTAEHVADVVAGPSTSGSSYVLRPIAVNRDGAMSAVKPGEIPAEPHWVGTVTSSVAGQTTAAQVSREGEYVIYWAPLRYQSGAELTQSFRHWWVSEAVDGGLSAAVDRLLNPGER